LWATSYRIRPQDFDVAEIARAALQEMVDKFIEDAKPSALQRIRIPIKLAKIKAIEVLEGSVQRDFSELKASVDNLEKWKENHEPVSRAPDAGAHRSDTCHLDI
jgi:hypothetical protein